MRQGTSEWENDEQLFGEGVNRTVASFAAVFRDVTGARCVTSRKTAAKETNRTADKREQS